MERAQLEALVAATGCAESHGASTFLVDPHWTPAQRDIFVAIKQSAGESQRSFIDQGWLCIPTGGSSGGLKFARHDEVTLGMAVAGFATHFGLSQVNSIDVLPPWHVSGLMARVRSAVTGGRHVAWAWKDLEQGNCPEIASDDKWTLSLVPTQLHRLLAQPKAVAWLRRLALIPLGGGPVWPALAEAAREARIPVVLCYGMTETAAMVSAQQPTDFASGDRSSGQVMPHAQIEIEEETGVIRIAGTSLMRGYWGCDDVPELATADLGRIDLHGRLWVQGRRDEMAITGGEKVNPAAVETVLRNSGLFADVAVLAVPHAEWGEELVAAYTASAPLSVAPIETHLEGQLGKFEWPKRFLYFREMDWPRNAQGKLNRSALRSVILASGDPSS